MEVNLFAAMGGVVLGGLIALGLIYLARWRVRRELERREYRAEHSSVTCMHRIDPNEACEECGLMGDHLETCSRYPEEWRHCQHEVLDPRQLALRPDGKGFQYDGCCLKCGKPIY